MVTIVNKLNYNTVYNKILYRVSGINSNNVKLLLVGALLIILLMVPNVFLYNPLKCLLRELFSINCPFCGMTRDFVLMAKFRLPQHNLFSIPMAIIIFVFYPMVLMLNIDIKLSCIQRRNIVMTLLMIMFIFNNIRW